MIDSGDRRRSEQLIDISIPYSSSVAVWPGDVPFSCGWTARRSEGSSVNLAAITTSTHAGTHADAPIHVEDDWPSSEHLDIDAFVGPCTVAALHATRGVQSVSRSELQQLLDGLIPTRLLLRTEQSVETGRFPDDWPTLDEDAASWLVDGGLRLFGTDAPSVDSRNSKTLPIHHRLFSGNAFVLENLALRHVSAGRYELLAQPLAITGADAAPVRALLRTV